jgi:Ca2+-binding RTX toxin-like protein
MIESLESRRLFSFTLAGGVLTVTGTGGNDIIRVLQQDATTLRLEDNGIVTTFTDTAVSQIRMAGLAGNDRLQVLPPVNESATLSGGDGNDSMSGGDGNDSFTGGAGIDTMSGNGGNDTFDGGTGADSHFGGAGTDTATYASRLAAVFVTTASNVANDGEAAEGDNVRTDIENVIGGAGSDELTGATGVNNVLTGNGGNDRLAGLGGNDTLSGGSGNDLMYGGAGDDRMLGGSGNDVMSGGSGADRLFGESGDDLFFTAGDPNGILAATNDQIDGGLGTDIAEKDLFDTIANVEVVFI